MTKNGAPLYYACKLTPDNVGLVGEFLQRNNMQLGQTLMSTCEPNDYLLLSIKAGNQAPRSVQRCPPKTFHAKWVRKDGENYADLFFPIKTPSLSLGPVRLA